MFSKEGRVGRLQIFPLLNFRNLVRARIGINAATVGYSMAPWAARYNWCASTRTCHASIGYLSSVLTCYPYLSRSGFLLSYLSLFSCLISSSGNPSVLPFYKKFSNLIAEGVDPKVSVHTGIIVPLYPTHFSLFFTVGHAGFGFHDHNNGQLFDVRLTNHFACV
jgi:hypothetical protein